MKRQNCLIRISILVIMVAALLIGCAQPAPTPAPAPKPTTTAPPAPTPTAKPAPVKWEYVDYSPDTHLSVPYQIEFMEKVKQYTEGGVEIIRRGAGQTPYATTDYVKVVRAGNAQMARDYMGFMAGDIPTLGLLGLPYLLGSTEEWQKGLVSLRPHIDAVFNKLNITSIWAMQWPGTNYWGRGTPMKTLEDIKGRKIRTISQEDVEVVKLLGGIPITITTPEVLQAWERGVVDAVHTTANNIIGSGWSDLPKWAWMPEVSFGATDFIFVNLDAFNQLPKEWQAAIRKAGAEVEPKMVQAQNKTEYDNRALLKNTKGVELIVPPATERAKAVQIVAPYWQTWADGKGEDGKKMLQALRQALGR